MLIKPILIKQASLTLVLIFLLAGCDQSTQQFNLPVGNAEQGRANFILLGCNSCHAVDGVQWDGTNTQDKINVSLGGKTTRIKTYADLVTSIINPSHKLSRKNDASTMTPTGESKMRNYNDVMSVQELIDLVTFLHAKYDIWVPQYYRYGP
ncbi:MAG: sulfur-oxidizing protein SoxX [Candidatus Azotimanducaceae bacterium]|jgi:sulfur-oxidizing protein SoxX